MNRKEIRELRKALQPEHSSADTIFGCYVDQDKQIIARFEEPVQQLMPVDARKYFEIFRRTLAGHLGKELSNIRLDTAGEDRWKQEALEKLRDEELGGDELRGALYRRIIDAIDLDGLSYVLLLIFDNYDVHGRSPSGRKQKTVLNNYRYFVCAVCPVKSGKEALDYKSEERRFRSDFLNEIVANPVLGFTYPAFNDRAEDDDAALFYFNKAKDNEKPFSDAIFGRSRAPLTAEEQREAFGDALRSTLQKDCTFEIVQKVDAKLRELILLHEASEAEEQLFVTVAEIGDILKDGGVPKKKIDEFCEQCLDRFGENRIDPANISGAKKITIKSPGVKITVDPKFGDAVQAKVIDGKRYITIPMQHGVSINGVSVD